MKVTRCARLSDPEDGGSVAKCVPQTGPKVVPAAFVSDQNAEPNRDPVEVGVWLPKLPISWSSRQQAAGDNGYSA